MTQNKKLFMAGILAAALGCAGPQGRADFSLTRSELHELVKAKNLTEAQRVIVRHAERDLVVADKVTRENAANEKKVESLSRLAGAGRLVYVILAVIGAGIVAFIVAKLRK